MNKFEFLKIYNSPFKKPKIKFYFGKIALGTPIFFPRKWVLNKNSRSKKAIDKKIGFDICGLGFKTKWEPDDYRFEWNPIWSFVFFGYQLAMYFTFDKCAPYHYWECWLYYHFETKGRTKDRVKQAKKGFPCVWTQNRQGKKKKICYWDLILKNKNLKKEDMEEDIKSYEVKLFTVKRIKKFKIVKEWCWKVVAINGELIGRSTESYVNKSDAIYNIQSLGASLYNYKS